jgi:hypothetical protein
MSYQRPLSAPPLLPHRRPRSKRAGRGRPGMIAQRIQSVASFLARRKIPAVMGGVAVIGAVIWVLPPIGNNPALADLLKEQGYWEIVAPADFYVPGTINTIEVRSDGKIALHPTCKIDAALLATMTLQSRTIDRVLAQRLNKKFDVSGALQELLSVGMGGSKIAKLNMSFQNSSILNITDEDLWQVRQGVVKGACQEAIKLNLNGGGRVCQTRSALKGDLVYDITYHEGITLQEQGKLTADVAATLKLEADQDRTDRMLGAGLIYGVKLMPDGILLNTPDARPADCRAELI